MSDTTVIAKSGIRVSIRIKPLDNPSEELAVKPNEHNVDNSIDVETNFCDMSSFTYGHIHWSTGNGKIDPIYATQEDVFNDVGKPIVESALQGFNCCVFAYGQTGSGKTYTMMGGGKDEQTQEGLIPRICRAILVGQDSDPSVIKTTFEVSYVELYLEKVKDLLGPATASNLKVRENPTTGPFVEGCSAHEVATYPQLLELLEHGNSNRHVAATKMNEVSSRSHVIFTLKVTQTKVDLDPPDAGIALEAGAGAGAAGTGGGFNSHLSSSKNNIVTCKVNLVDLAGSESVKLAATSGERLKEGASINKSLLTLGRVIKALAAQAQGQKKARRSSLVTPQEDKEKPNSGSKRRGSMGSGHNHGHNSSSETEDEPFHTHTPTSSGSAAVIPYRESVLTFLLKESLGGNSSSALIAAVRPGKAYLEETMSTLRFAAQAGRVENKPVVNETNPYIKTISALRKQIEDLSKELSIARGVAPPGLPPSGADSLACSPSTAAMMDPAVGAAVAAAQASVEALEALSLAHDKAAAAKRNSVAASDADASGCEVEEDVVYALPEEGAEERLSQEMSPDRITLKTTASAPTSENVGVVAINSSEGEGTTDSSNSEPSAATRLSDGVLVDASDIPEESPASGVRQTDQIGSGYSTPLPDDASSKGGLRPQTWTPVASPAGSLMPPHVIKYTPSPTNRSTSSSPTPPKSTTPPPKADKGANGSQQPAAVIGGYLLKRGFLNTAYKQRWCILLHNRIIFYVGYYGQVRGSINLYQCTINQHPNTELQFENGENSFELTTPNDPSHKHWMLQALTAPEKVNWMLAIQAASQLSDEVTHDRTRSISNIDSFTSADKSKSSSGSSKGLTESGLVAPPGQGQPGYASDKQPKTWWGFVSGTR